MRARVDGTGTPQPLVQLTSGASSLAIDSSHIYIASFSRVSRVDISGANLVPNFITNTGAPSGNYFLLWPSTSSTSTGPPGRHRAGEHRRHGRRLGMDADRADHRCRGGLGARLLARQREREHRASRHRRLEPRPGLDPQRLRPVRRCLRQPARAVRQLRARLVGPRLPLRLRPATARAVRRRVDRAGEHRRLRRGRHVHPLRGARRARSAPTRRRGAGRPPSRSPRRRSGVPGRRDGASRADRRRGLPPRRGHGHEHRGAPAGDELDGRRVLRRHRLGAGHGVADVDRGLARDRGVADRRHPHVSLGRPDHPGRRPRAGPVPRRSGLRADERDPHDAAGAPAGLGGCAGCVPRRHDVHAARRGRGHRLHAQPERCADGRRDAPGRLQRLGPQRRAAPGRDDEWQPERRRLSGAPSAGRR